MTSRFVRRHRPEIEFVALTLIALALLAAPTIAAPFRWLDTLAHELAHGLVAWITGGAILRIELNLDGSGLIWHRGSSSPAMVAFWGYPGAALAGVVVYLTAEEGGAAARAAPLAIALITAAAAILWMRDLESLVIAIVIVLTFAFWRKAAEKLGRKRARWPRLALKVLGLYMTLAAIRAAFGLIGHAGPSDAQTLAERVLPPAGLWASIWLLMALAAMLFLWRRR